MELRIVVLTVVLYCNLFIFYCFLRCFVVGKDSRHRLAEFGGRHVGRPGGGEDRQTRRGREVGREEAVERERGRGDYEPHLLR